MEMCRVTGQLMTSKNIYPVLKCVCATEEECD